MSYTPPVIVSGLTRLTKELIDGITRGIEDAHDELVHASYAGTELAAAETVTQFAWSGTDWNNVPGLTLTFATDDGPAYLRAQLGTVVVHTVKKANISYRILDVTSQQPISTGAVTVIGDTDGTQDGDDVTGIPILEARILAGLPERTYQVQVQSPTGVGAYVTPGWMQNAVSTFVAVGA